VGSADGGAPALTAAAIAECVGGTVVGDGARVVRVVSTLRAATPDSVAFLADRRYADEARASAAGVVLVTAALQEAVAPGATRVLVEAPHQALVTLLPLLYPEPPRPLGVHPTAVVDPSVVLADGVTVGPYAVVEAGAELGTEAWVGPHCVVGRGVRIGAGSRLVDHVTCYPGTRIGARVTVHAGSRLGSDGFGYAFTDGAHRKIPHVGGCVIEDDVEIGANCTIDRGSVGDTVVGAGSKLDNLVHVGHNVRVGRLCLLMAHVGVAGSATLGDGVVLAGQSGVSGHVTVGAGARIAAKSGVISDVPPGETWSGFPARPHQEQLRGYAAVRRLSVVARALEAMAADRGAS
jgi:UDP-3-O-[3-hydroxymyristoyl] glucosamine N-acyltransferase